MVCWQFSVNTSCTLRGTLPIGAVLLGLPPFRAVPSDHPCGLTKFGHVAILEAFVTSCRAYVVSNRDDLLPMPGSAPHNFYQKVSESGVKLHKLGVRFSSPTPDSEGSKMFFKCAVDTFTFSEYFQILLIERSFKSSQYPSSLYQKSKLLEV